jgi:GNAT superfamily N-acetyltransferase
VLRNVDKKDFDVINETVSLNLEIRPATSDDVPTILAFIRKLAEYEKLADAVVATEAGLREWLFCVRPYAEVLLAILDGRPAGFALFFHNFSTFVGKPGIYLEDLFVDVEHRGKGIGKALLLDVIRLADERHCGRVEWSVLNWNEPAIAFYESLGAVAMKEWTVYRLTEERICALAARAPA